jgi:hypothetical protein
MGCAAGAGVVILTVNAQGQGNSGNFDTVLGAAACMPVCVQLKGGVMTKWSVYNGTGRMVTVQGATTVAAQDATAATGNAIAAGTDGNVYFNFTACSGSNAMVYTSVGVY